MVACGVDHGGGSSTTAFHFLLVSENGVRNRNVLSIKTPSLSSFVRPEVLPKLSESSLNAHC
jgi:hypothetical protein